MSYVPIVPPTDRTRLSPRARELATQIEKAIQEFQRNYPDTPSSDVQEALRALSGETERAPASRQLLALTLAGGIAALVGVMFFVQESGSGGSPFSSDTTIWVVAGVIGILALVFAMNRR